MAWELAQSRFLLVSWQELIVALEKGDISKDVMLALFANMNGVAEVPKWGADHVGRQDVPQLEFLSFLVVGSF